MSEPIDISPSQHKELLALIQRHLPNVAVWAFGSRVKWTARSNSDLDLVAFARPEDQSRVSRLKEAIEESSLPFRVDLLVWDNIPESFQKNIQARYVVLVEGGQADQDRVMTSNPHPFGWETKPLFECTADGVISYGIVQPGQHVHNGIPIVRVNNFKGGTLDVSDVLRVAESIEANYQRTRLQGGEVLLTLVGSVGQIAIVPNSLAGWNVARAVAVIRPSVEISARWLCLCLQSRDALAFLDGRANTTVQKTLNLSDVKQVPIVLPPPGIRSKIEAIAECLEGKIDLNRRINQTLEAMAQAIFKSWFVDFDPVKAKIAAKQAGRDPLRAAMSAISGKTEAELDTLPPEQYHQLATTAALFPDEMEESELGEIPRGWKVDVLSSEIDVLNGFAFKSEDYAADGIFVLRTRNFFNGIVEPTISDVFLPSEFLESHERYICEPFDYHLVMVGASVGDRGMIFPELLPALRNQNMWCFRPKIGSSISKPQTKLLLDRLAPLVAGLASGSAREFFRKGDFENQKICFGSDSIMKAFKIIVSPLFDKQSNTFSQNIRLSQLRDSLLPKLLSGELSVEALAETHGTS